MPARTRTRPDDQDDYEDPIDRYRPRDDDGPRPKKKKSTNANANVSYSLGLTSLIPCVGAVLGPVAVVFAFLGLAQANRYPEGGGKGRAKSGLWFGLLGCFINYGLPAIFVVLTYLVRV